MHEIVFDIIIGIVILGIIIIAVKLFDTNLKIIDSSASDKDVEISQVKEYQAGMANSRYTVADILAYINNDKIAASTNEITISDPIVVPPTQYVIHGDVNRQADIVTCSNYLKTILNSTNEYSFDRADDTFVRVK